MLFGAACSLVLLFASCISAAPTTFFFSSVAPSSHPSRTTSLPSPLSFSSSTAFHSFPQTTQSQKKNFGHERSQRIAAIALGVLAGSITLSFLAAILRCTCKYKPPPKRDRIAEILQRHTLQCEMQELERNPYALRPPSLQEPPPPYFPRPPSYSDSLMKSSHQEEVYSTVRHSTPSINFPHNPPSAFAVHTHSFSATVP